MFERFTERARKIMALGNQEAQRFNHEYIGTEHILLGLLKEGTGVGANVLRHMGIDLSKLRKATEKEMTPGPEMVAMGKLPQTPRAKKVIEYAIEEARGLDHNYIGSEHLLLGLLREEDGVAAKALAGADVKIDPSREEILTLIGPGVGATDDQTDPPDPEGVLNAITAILATLTRPDGNASVVYLDWAQGKLRIRYNVKGAIVDDGPLPRQLGSAVIAGIRKLVGLPSIPTDLPQEGHIDKLAGQTVGLRVTDLPTEAGDVVIIRAAED